MGAGSITSTNLPEAREPLVQGAPLLLDRRAGGAADAGAGCDRAVDREHLAHLGREVLGDLPVLLVARLVELGVNGGKDTNPDMVCGVCGETGGDPDSIQVYYDLGLDYVSCSPFRVPIARLAAAQAKIKSNGGPAKLEK